MGNDKIKIFLSYHKKTPCYKSDVFQPLYAGAQGENKEPIDFAIPDNSGDNISELNPYYCELTGHYWVLKNYLDTCNEDYIGFGHYRRIPDLTATSDKDVPSIFGMSYSESGDFFEQLKTQNLTQYLMLFDVVLPCACYMYENTVNPQLRDDEPHYNVYEHFHKEHKNDLLDTLKAVFTLVYPDDLPVLEEVYGMEKSHFYNMYCMRTPLMKDFLNWEFEILEYMGQAIGGWNQEQYRRMAGFVGETLINIWLKLPKNKGLQIGYAPVYMIDFESEYIERVNEYHSQGKYNEALEELKQLLPVASEPFAVSFSIAEISFGINNFEQGQEYLNKAFGFAQRGEDYFRLAMLVSQVSPEDVDIVSELYEKAIEIQPDEKIFALSYVAFTDQLHDVNRSAKAWPYLLKFELTPEEQDAYNKFKKVYDMVNKA